MKENTFFFVEHFDVQIFTIGRANNLSIFSIFFFFFNQFLLFHFVILNFKFVLIHILNCWSKNKNVGMQNNYPFFMCPGVLIIKYINHNAYMCFVQ